MKCPNCNVSLPDNAMFCRNCGTSIKNISQQTSSESLTIGRAPGNSIVVNSSNISSQHAKLIVDNNSVWILDLNSTNGTFVNGKRISKSIITPNDNVYLGTAPLDLRNSSIQNLFNRVPIQTQIPSKTLMDTPQQVPYSVPVPQQNAIHYNPIQNQPQIQSQSLNQQIIINTPQKSKNIFLAVILAFFFGPFGMLYATISGALIMLGVNAILFFPTVGIFSYFVSPIICAIWAGIAVDNENKKSPNVISNINN